MLGVEAVVDASDSPATEPARDRGECDAWCDDVGGAIFGATSASFGGRCEFR